MLQSDTHTQIGATIHNENKNLIYKKSFIIETFISNTSYRFLSISLACTNNINSITKLAHIKIRF